MKITREIIINGQSQQVEFELTGIELDRAYNEAQFQYDKTEVCARLKENGYERVDDIPDEIIAQMAEDFRNEMTAIMEGMGDGRIPAMETVISRHKEDLEEYKHKWKCYCAKVIQTKERYFTIRAKNEDEAKDILNKFLNDNWREAEEYFEDEDSEFDTTYIDIDDGDPDDAEVKGDE